MGVASLASMDNCPCIDIHKFVHARISQWLPVSDVEGFDVQEYVSFQAIQFSLTTIIIWICSIKEKREEELSKLKKELLLKQEYKI